MSQYVINERFPETPLTCHYRYVEKKQCEIRKSNQVKSVFKYFLRLHQVHWEMIHRCWYYSMKTLLQKGVS